MRTSQLLILVGAAAATSAALGQSAPPDYGFTWRTIGDPGNPAAQPSDYVFLDRPVGEVDTTYRMTQTEVTNTQWVAFANAYKQVNPNVNVNDHAFSGRYVVYDQSLHTFAPVPGAENAPVIVSWMYAARFVNWLQNGEAVTSSAFETGVYDVSTIIYNQSTGWTGQTTRAAGSQFWLPDLDEWDKAMHWDPNKNGPGRGGYWLYPNSSDTAPIGGPPGTPGAQTNAYSGAPLFMSVGSYPDQRSPWGLLDGSGGAEEYLDGWSYYTWLRGSRIGTDFTTIADRLDAIDAFEPIAGSGGFRIASSVPAPGAWVPVIALFLSFSRRPRHE